MIYTFWVVLNSIFDYFWLCITQILWALWLNSYRMKFDSRTTAWNLTQELLHGIRLKNYCMEFHKISSWLTLMAIWFFYIAANTCPAMSCILRCAWHQFLGIYGMESHKSLCVKFLIWNAISILIIQQIVLLTSLPTTAADQWRFNLQWNLPVQH